MLRVLLLEDSPQDVDLIREMLTNAGFALDLDCTAVEKEFVALLRSRRYDAILADFRLPGFDAFSALRWSMEIAPDIPFICVSGSIGEETAVELLKTGALDYVLKDKLGRLPAAINRAMEEVKEKETRKRMSRELESQHSLLTALINSPKNIIIFSLDNAYRYTAFNERHREEMKRVWHVDITIGVNLLDCMTSPDIRALAKQSIDRALSGEAFSETQYQADRDIYYDLSWNPVLQDHTVVGATAFIRDITERKAAERELTLMAQTMASARDCISITDLENNILFVNDAFQHTYGYATNELVGQDIAIVRTSRTPAAIPLQILHDTQMGGWHGEILNRRKDGSELPVELWTSLVRNESGTPVAMVGVARDITDRKLSEEHLRQSDEQFRLIAENVADMIAVLDLEGRRIYYSPSYKNLLGDLESMKGTDGFQEVHPDDRERVKSVFRETVRTGLGQRTEYRFLLKDGSVRDIDSKGSVIRDSEGKISQVVVVSRDVTEEKKLAAQFLQAQRMESIGTLAGGIAHDLNNVLAPIMMAIEVLRTKIPDKGSQKILATIGTSAQRGADIVRQVLAFGRGVKGDRILVQLSHVIDEVAKIAGETFPKSIVIESDLPRDLWTVSADPTQMHQVLLNMLVNARDAMPRGGALTISGENITLDELYPRKHLGGKPGMYVSIAITDTGTGIPEDIRDKIFDPFFTTKEIGMGTGLGLSTTLAIVKSHGGFINLYSEVGKGTTFRVYIPATGTAACAGAGRGEADLPVGNGELILVIDDEAAIREVTKVTLEAYGYKAMTASNGAEGIAVFAENVKTIKAVITDIMMPVMDGAATILELRRINPEVKIIAASGLTVHGKLTTPPDLNVLAFLTKPFTAEKLLKALESVLT